MNEDYDVWEDTSPLIDPERLFADMKPLEQWDIKELCEMYEMCKMFAHQEDQKELMKNTQESIKLRLEELAPDNYRHWQCFPNQDPTDYFQEEENE